MHGDVRQDLWALRHATLRVDPGEKLGIIGPNGSGKSTFLKLLARITEPTEGSAVLRGRVGSLLEVGTGFHNELTGRENVFLSGAILGMRRAEIKQRFDEIVDFAGVESFLDTPVKRYSSGMRVRLGFSVAAHLQPEILLVDEVLAVGDAEFQRRCVGKMNEVAREGRTVLFVSHNMGSVADLCDRVIVLERGAVVLDGSPESAIEAYLSQSMVGVSGELMPQDHRITEGLVFTSVHCSEAVVDVSPAGTQGHALVRFAFTLGETVPGLSITIGLASLSGVAIAYAKGTVPGGADGVVPGRYEGGAELRLPLVDGHYVVSLGADRPDRSRTAMARVPRASTFVVQRRGTDRSVGDGVRHPAPVALEAAWEFEPTGAQG